jgi:DNA polymerase-3 subunit beta
MVSTDGHRLTKYSVALEGPVLRGGIIIPRKGMEEIRKVLNRVEGACRLGISDQYLFVQANALLLSVKLHNVTFPPWRQVVPPAFTSRAEVACVELTTALRQALVMAPEKTATVKLQLDKGSLTLNADNPELGAITLDLPVKYSGATLTSGFNAHYLLDAIGAIDTETAYLDFQGVLEPCVVRPANIDGEAADFLSVVMPMRI